MDQLNTEKSDINAITGIIIIGVALYLIAVFLVVGLAISIVIALIITLGNYTKSFYYNVIKRNIN